ncbi:CHRD domain-containing protein [Nocardioides sp.]|uniref:CHRD domain-containing protein n=1 Tax=Nocardioides sp. TaxID=35761 RepID=UPI0026228CE6|nr:CHRD domain-containing protein [Nocardioides sp.]MDI6909382.1 CHRD domain-containing protein [Nocardioides sp.]
MSIHTRRAAAALGTVALLAVGTFATSPTAAAPASRAAAQRLEATLRPSGDPDGSGEAHLTLNKARGKVCATVTWEHIDDPDAAHIHRVSDGSIVVDLSGSVTGGARCTSGVPARTVGRILRHPRRYYFNVHNATYPAGAIQGRLHR